MEQEPQTPTAHVISDPRQHESIRFLVRGGLLPPVVDDQFWLRLKFIRQASNLGLSVGDIRCMLAADPVVEIKRQRRGEG